jgi:hypothetical protein
LAVNRSASSFALSLHLIEAYAASVWKSYKKQSTKRELEPRIMDNRFRVVESEPLVSGYRVVIQCGDGKPIVMSSSALTLMEAIDDLQAQLARYGIDLDLRMESAAAASKTFDADSSDAEASTSEIADEETSL